MSTYTTWRVIAAREGAFGYGWFFQQRPPTNIRPRTGNIKGIYSGIPITVWPPLPRPLFFRSRSQGCDRKLRRRPYLRQHLNVSRTQLYFDAYSAASPLSCRSISMTTYSNLPFDIIHYLCSVVATVDRGLLKRLSVVDKRTRAASIPILFRSVAFKPRWERDQRPWDGVESRLKALIENEDIMNAVRCVVVSDRGGHARRFLSGRSISYLGFVGEQIRRFRKDSSISYNAALVWKP